MKSAPTFHKTGLKHSNCGDSQAIIYIPFQYIQVTYMKQVDITRNIPYFIFPTFCDRLFCIIVILHVGNTITINICIPSMSLYIKIH